VKRFYFFPHVKRSKKKIKPLKKSGDIKLIINFCMVFYFMSFITLYSPLVSIKSTQNRYQLLQPTHPPSGFCRQHT
jgi:hypothetical protein